MEAGLTTLWMMDNLYMINIMVEPAGQPFGRNYGLLWKCLGVFVVYSPAGQPCWQRSPVTPGGQLQPPSPRHRPPFWQGHAGESMARDFNYYASNS